MNEHSVTRMNGVVGYRPESPFITDPVADAPPREATRPAYANGVATPFAETPFLSESTAGGGVAPGPRAAAFAHLLAEFHDTELDEALADVANEAAALVDDRYAYETGDPARQRADAERAVRDYLEPLEREAEAMLERLRSELADRDPAALTEAEIDAVVDRSAPRGPFPSPTFEHFLKKLLKKAKKVVSAAKKLASKVLPVDAILGKLKALVKPLIERVLRFAIDKIPPAFQPAAVQLAKKMLGIEVSLPAAADGTASSDGSAGVDPDGAQEEMDAALAGYAIHGEAFEHELELARFAARQAPEGADVLGELDAGRARFAREITSLQPGEDPAPVVERFLPAVLAAARIGVKLIGRERVVDFLAKQIAKLISRFVGPQAAQGLSRSLVDAGMKLVSLEAGEEAERLAAGYTLASTVEGTVQRLAAAPAAAWESEALLEAYALEAFERAAAADFPDAAIKPELREASVADGAWVLMPPGPGQKLYKKYTNVLEVQLTPQVASSIRTFGGVSLATAMRDRLGVKLDAPVTVRVHLYQAIRGTWLSRISLHEKGVRGLGSAARVAWTNIHPLTKDAAAALFREPGLGVDVAPTYLADRNRIAVGQRFYFLELPALALPTESLRTTSTSVLLDFPRSELKLVLFYSERDAQELAALLRSKAVPGAILKAFAAGLDLRLRAVLADPSSRSVRVVHEAEPFQQFAGAAALLARIPAPVRDAVIQLLVEWVLKVLASEVEKAYARFADGFGRAAAAPEDGVSLVIVFRRPSFLDALKRLMDGKAGALAVLGPLGATPTLWRAMADFSVEIQPGFAG